MEDTQFEEVSWDEIKNKKLDILVTDESRREILIKAGYRVDGEGYLIDGKTNQKVIAEDGLEINLEKDKEFGLVAGSHIFVRNIAGYAHVLTNQGLVKIQIIK
jgi:hypothetical protein